MINAESLRKLTENALAENARKAAVAKQAAENKEKAKNLREAAQAKGIIDGILPLAETAARQSLNFLEVMQLDFDDYQHNRLSNSIDSPNAINLIGAARIVWDYCEANNLQPSIESWHDGVGIRGGYNLVIHW